MSATTTREVLRPVDFAICPAWRYDQDLERYFEVRNLDDLDRAESSDDLQILVDFTTPTGRRLAGKVVGVQDVYAIGLFVNDEVVMINKNMQQDSQQQVTRFLNLSGLAGELNLETLFPLRFESKWGSATFNDFSGVFDLSF